MKKAIVILILAVLSLSFGFALAADGVLYRDDELGFSFVMPSDYEYYGDTIIEAEEFADVDMSGIEKQPMYTGFDSNINIVYDKDSDEFDAYEKALPNNMTRDEIDLHLFEKEVQLEAMDAVVDSIVNMLGNTLISSQTVDYGGKLCVVVVSKGHDAASDLDYYQQSVSFFYKDYYISITYTKLDINGGMKQEAVLDQFDQVFDTLEFDTVPSDISAKLKSGITFDWTRIAIWGVSGALIGGVTTAIVNGLKKRKIKKLAEANSNQDKGDNDGL